MQLGAKGLVAVPTPDLEKLLRFVHRGDLDCPLTVPGLARVGLQHVADRLEHLRGLPSDGVRAVVVAVLAERREEARRRERSATRP